MNTKSLFMSLAIMMTASGCTLQQAPDCLYKDVKCELDDLMHNGLYYTCSPDGTWSIPVACKHGCDDKLCQNEMPNCENEGEIRCNSSSDNDKYKNKDVLVYSETCIEHKWIVNICHSGVCSDKTGCRNTDETHPCQNGAGYCMTDDVLGVLHIVCVDEQWRANYGDSEADCNADSGSNNGGETNGSANPPGT